MRDISHAALLITGVFLLFPLWVSHRHQLGIAKEIALSSLRGAVQLVLIGYVIGYIFSIESWLLLALFILAMIVIAGLTSARRGKQYAHAFPIACAAILAAEAVSLAVWLTFFIIEPKAQYVLPMSGMIIGSSMTVASLTFERMLSEFQLTKPLILAKLALGASPRQACQELMENTIKAALIPNIESMKSLGLIHLPGMMTGAIIAGASPLIAVKYQLVILLTAMSTAAITAILVSFLAYRSFFRQKMF